ncbi:MAG: amylo-alpha-1,6-glucosidase [Arachnia sp.]
MRDTIEEAWMPPITFGTQVCGDLDAGSQREWLLSDGLGGYAMGTVGGLRTRRYHGLLTIAETPARRHLAIASLDATLILPSGTKVPLGVHEWLGGAVAPEGHRLLERFDLIDGLPRWRWRVGDVVLEREVAMAHGSTGVAVEWRQLAGPACELLIQSLVTWRDSHAERHGDRDLAVEHDATGVVVEGRFRVEGPAWEPDGRWYRDVFMREEAARGLTPSEDLWSAGFFHAHLDGPGAHVGVRAWGVDGPVMAPASHVITHARSRARDVVRRAGASSAVGEHLALAADAFVITGPDVVAGYPWFGTWSRDTMISFEGLFLETGRHAEGRDLLLGYGQRLDGGMLPNTADTGSLEYNTVDGTLWFVHALDRHLHRTGDTDLAATAAPWLRAIIDAHIAGARYGIRVDSDALLTQGQDGVALTWMDARIDGVPVTPRVGKPVEVNGLWINALAVANDVLGRAGSPHDDLQRLEQAARDSFTRRFRALPGSGIPDLVDGPHGDDTRIRPNQVIAASLPHGPAMDPAWLDAVRDLLTPLGLRTLHPDDGDYRGVHAGDPRARDLAYHQGTVWPWLVGPWVTASLRAGHAPTAALAGLETHLGEWGLGSVSETAYGDAPHTATGTPFQAWSVAEVLRARRLLDQHATHQPVGEVPG